MDAIVDRLAVFLIGILTMILPINAPASALSADLANKCRAIAIKAHPPTRVGAKAGSAGAQRDLFRSCLANSGGAPDNDTKPGAAPVAK